MRVITNIGLIPNKEMATPFPYLKTHTGIGITQKEFENRKALHCNGNS